MVIRVFVHSAQAIKKMALLHRVWISSCLIVLLLSYGESYSDLAALQFHVGVDRKSYCVVIGSVE